MLNIVFLDRNALPEGQNLPKFSFEHNYTEYATTSKEQIIERAKDAEIIITSKVPLTADILVKLPKLKLIAITATGVNNVDLEQAKELNIVVKNVLGYSHTTVPEHILALIFALKHSLVSSIRDQATSNRWAECGQFCYFDTPVTDIAGSTLTILGKGVIGKSLALKAKALGMEVIFAERQNNLNIRPGYVEFNEALKQADIVSLACPLTRETENLINAKTLKLMKPSAILINTGRGALVNEKDLLNALQNKTIAGAGLDVLVKEPPKIDNPLVQYAKTASNLVITPHIAWSSNSALQTLVAKVAENIETFVKTGK